MSAPQFRTPELANLYDELRGWDHPECPFLDPNYSTGSYAPAADFTLYVAQWLAAGKMEAVEELWSYLNPVCDSSRALLRKALRARRPTSIHLADWQWYELWAMHLMILRMSLVRGPGDGVLVLSKLAAIIVALEPITVDPNGEQRLLRATRSEVDDRSPGDGATGRTGAALHSVTKAQSELGNAGAVVDRLRLVAPMVRLVVHDYCTRNWGEGMLRHSLYYSERMYGCGHAWNKHFVEWLGFFEPWTDDSRQVPAAVRKDVLRDALAGQGIQTKKTETRESLLEKAREVPGLLLDLIQKARPDRQQLRVEWADPVQKWSHRVSAVEAAAIGVVKHF